MARDEIKDNLRKVKGLRWQTRRDWFLEEGCAYRMANAAIMFLAGTLIISADSFVSATQWHIGNKIGTCGIIDVVILACAFAGVAVILDSER